MMSNKPINPSSWSKQEVKNTKEPIMVNVPTDHCG